MARTFVGRERQREALATAITDVLGGRGDVVLVTGEPGIGKTSLVDHVLRGSPGPAVGWGVARPTARSAPLRPWRDALRVLQRAIGAQADEVLSRHPAATAMLEGSTTRDVPVSELHDEVIEALLALAASTPIVLAFDDLQWAGEDSIALLDAVARRARLAPVLVVGTCRDDAPASLAAIPATRVPLGGLSAAEVAALVGVPEEEGAGLVQRTGGNPLFALELRALEAAGRGGEIPASVDAAVAERLAGVPARGFAVVAAAAVLGEEFETRTAQVVAETDDLEALRSAVERRLVVPVPGALLRHRFAHSLVREVVLSRLGDHERSSLEHRAAAVVATRGASAARVAHHLRLAAALQPTLLGDAAAAAVRAAEEAEGLLAWEAAAQEREAAVDLANAAGFPHAERVGHELRLASALERAGRPEQARAVHLRVAASASASDDAEALALAALGLSGGLGGFEVGLQDAEQIALLREAIAQVEQAGLRAHLTARLSVALTFIADADERLTLADDAIETATGAGDALALAAALAARCDALAGPRHNGARLLMADQMLSAAAAAGSVEHVLLALRLRLVAQLERGDLVRARVTIEAFEREANRLGQARHRWYVPLWRSALAAADGEIAVAVALNDEARIIGERGGSRNAWVLTTSQWVMHAVDRGELVTARDHARRVVLENPEIRGPETGLAWMEAMLGNHAVARAHLDRMAADLSLIAEDSEWLSVMTVLTETATIVGHRKVLEELVERLEPFSDQHVVDGIGDAYLGAVAGIVGGARAALGDVETAKARYEQAIAAQDTAGGRRRAAYWRLGLADVVRATDPSRAQVLEEEAAALDATAAATYRLRTRRSAATAPGRGAVTVDASLVREGEVWRVGFGERVVRLRHAKGFEMVAVLVDRVGREVPASELDGSALVDGAPGPILDARAKDAYRSRLRDLEDELDDADRCHDPMRAARAQEEMDALVQELSRAVGLRGRDRVTGEGERARMRVTKALRSAIDRIGHELPDLGAHLQRSVRTGSFCSYCPDPAAPIVWTVDVGR